MLKWGNAMVSLRPLDFLWLLAGLLVALAAVRPAVAEEAILDYRSRIVINADATLTVTETLRVRAEGNAIKRGIFRAFPTRYRDRRGEDVKVAFEVLDVQRDGRPEPFRVETAPNGSILYIGQPDVLLEPGETTYTLVYRANRQIGYLADVDELYWNVTGGDWALPRQRVEAVVVLPYGAPVLRQAAYTGWAGQRGEAYAVDRDANDDIRFTTTRPLGPGEDLTIAVAWRKGYVAEPSAAEAAWETATDNASALAGAAGLLLVLAAHGAMWRRVGRDPRRGPIVRVSAPPRGLSPAAMRYVLRREVDDKAFAAALVDMAVKGAIAIEAGEVAFTLRRLGEGGAALSPGEAKVFATLFGGSRETMDIGRSYHPVVGAARAALAGTLKAEFGRALFSTNRAYLLPGAALSALTLAAMILAAPSPADAAGVMIFCALALGALAFFGSRGLAAFQRRGRGGRPMAPIVFGAVLLAAVAGMAAAVGKATLEVVPPMPFALLVLIILVNALFLHLMSAPTLAGRRMMDAIEGFRMYLAETPQPRPEHLPYALALDLEHEWGERLAAALGAEPFHPAWYSGQPGERSTSDSFAAALAGGLAGAVSASANAPGSA
ncbi:MAG: DUF2207 domain-containing protein, partial [Rhodospirillales bacterium]|nr:DUF2207 domain-containing protein [Rhodospirillales bacterium]